MSELSTEEVRLVVRDEYEDRIEALEMEVEALIDRAEKAEYERDELKEENETLRDRAEKAERERDELRGQVEDKETTVMADGGAEASVTSSVTPAEDHSPDLEPRVNALEDKADTHEERLDEVETKQTGFGGAINSNQNRIDDIEETSSRSRDDGDLENTLPIQQTTRIWKVGGTIKTNKTEHAAAIWSDFFDRASKGRGVRYLDTGKVKGILKEHFRNDDRHDGVGKHVARSTIHRAMDVVVEMAGNLVSKDTIKNGRSALIINDEEFDEFCELIGATNTDTVTDDVTSKEGGTVTRAT